ncbi:MAG: alcohol dehydrogenase catalytic domain-containing protein [Actinobacteria bacterium]|nr:alcohol dehydrogenase catalytic domain-containing protein [Actinomycetota bacterium]
MRGLVLEGVEDVRYAADLPDPDVLAPTDAVVRVTAAGVCGSDLHPYLGREPVAWGTVPGHELVGEVVAVGADVTSVRTGDRVLAPFTTSCGDCGPCRRGLSARCEHGRLLGYGPPGATADGILHGAQAELVRVPLADGTLVAVPDGLDDATAVLLCDNLPTGWYAAERAGVGPGTTVAVVGLGAVGLCAVSAAFALGAARVHGFDPVADRRERARRLGAEVADPDDAGGHRGLVVDATIEAAGPAPAQRFAAALVAPGGTLSIIAVQTAEAFGVPPVLAYDRNLTIRTGRAPVRSLLARLLPRIGSGELAVPTDVVVTHPDVPLEDGPAAYTRFAAREAGLVKVVLRP